MLRLLAVAALLIPACSGDEAPAATSCRQHADCPQGYSCRVSLCVADGSVTADKSCTVQRQCATGLVCYQGACHDGCKDYYRTTDCMPGTWCRPIAGASRGECVGSECSGNSVCVDGASCVEVAAGLSACLFTCDYGFVGDVYQDTCADDLGDLACHPVGEASAAACLVAGGPTGPGPGDACNPIDNPCQSGSICVDVVCRKLCRTSQASPCRSGEACAPMAVGSTFYFCQ